MREDIKKSSLTLARWVLISAVTGVVGSGLVASFLYLLDTLTLHLAELEGITEAILPALGATFAGFIILRKFPESGGEGVPVYIVGTNVKSGKLDFLSALLRYPVTLISLVLKFSGGIVGPMVHSSAGLGTFLSDNLLRKFKLIRKEDLRIASVCSVSAAISAIFHSPLGGALFAAEVLQSESMKYMDLMPALMAGVVSTLFTLFTFKSEPFIVVRAPILDPDGSTFLWLPLAALFAGLVGMLFIFFFDKLTEFLRKITPTQPSKALVGSIVIVVLTYLNADWLLGVSRGVPDAIVNGSISEIYSPHQSFNNITLFLIILISAKAVATSITIGSGMSAGFTGPLIIIGLASGALFSTLMGIPSGTPVYHSFLACGMSAIFGAVMNIPLAAVVITIKIFGTSYIIPALIGSTVTFIIFRSINIYESRAHKYI